MGKRITLIFLFVITFLVLSSVDVKTKDKQNLSEVDRKLMVLNKPAIKSIKGRTRTSSIVNSTNDKSSGNNGSKIQVFPPPTTL
ncbi:hypothetical protein CFP56_024714 [Quercus suber]|uniref:Uncharacterized protein n=1 Tax=Quercus suber TaxID=58331 RepID=A0AAW0K8R6_QUESU